MKRLIRLTLEKIGFWPIILGIHRAVRKMQLVAYATAVKLRLGFGTQLRLLPPQFLEQPIFIDPSMITQCLVRPGLPAYRPVSDGDWDLASIPLMPRMWELNHFRLMYELFVDHKTFDETDQFREMEQELRTRGETVHHNFTSIKEINDHMATYQPIFDDILANGYKTQEELGNPPFIHEMKVFIGRNGDIMYVTQGTHRLAMAKILDLHCIPVGVWTVHRLWAEHCFKKYGGGVLASIYKGLGDLGECFGKEKIEPTYATGTAQELETPTNSTEPTSKDY